MSHWRSSKSVERVVDYLLESYLLLNTEGEKCEFSGRAGQYKFSMRR